MIDFLKGSKLYSVFTSTCPVCQQENMYKDRNPYHLRNAFKMHERCSHCNTKYKIEPSFFFGAMYVSYGLGVAVSVAAFIICFYLLHLEVFSIFLVITGCLIVVFPVIMRLSRNIWINLFLHYDKKKGLEK